MAELTQNQIERRYDKAASNPVTVNIPALPGLFFRPLTLGERGQSSRAYSKALMEYQAQGLPSEYLLSATLKRAVESSGLSMAVLRQKASLYEKQMKAIPEDLQGPYDQLTPAEESELPPDVQAERDEAKRARGRRIVELLAGALTDEDRDTLSQINQIEQLEQHLRQQTAEVAARRDQAVAEILMGAVTAEAKPYFADVEALAAVEPQEALVDLMVAWHQFKEGMPSDFFSRS